MLLLRFYEPSHIATRGGSGRCIRRNGGCMSAEGANGCPPPGSGVLGQPPHNESDGGSGLSAGPAGVQPFYPSTAWSHSFPYEG